MGDKLYVASLFQIGVASLLVGVFSTPAKAISAGEKMMVDIKGYLPPMHDWDHGEIDHQYFFDGFTLSVVETTLDQAV